MYFLKEAITESGIKVVLSGEGADEILEVIVRNAPSAEEFQKKQLKEYKVIYSRFTSCR
jgi:asparagine synthase (glutamine-hydrolysing)